MTFSHVATPTAMAKYLCLGLPRSGTSSLHHGVLALGLRSVHHIADPDTRRELERGRYRLSIFERTDLLIDEVAPVVFVQIAEAMPELRFIYTFRDEDSWLASMAKLAHLHEVPRTGSFRYYSRLAMFGVTVFHESRLRQVWREHDARVRDYFRGPRAERLLIMDITGGDGFDKLCPFLGLPEPGLPFPHVNRDGSIRRSPASLGRRLRRRYLELLG
ncbi:MAG: sulfotransferase [Thermaurantiacus sp.]|nr:sulfotransferase [Thermaurantiacus sp.]